MEPYLPFVIIGITTGAVYALASLGLVLTYRASGVFNFAHGAIGMFCTYLFYSQRQHLPTGLALILTLTVVAPLVGIVVDMLFRHVASAGPIAQIASSVGLLVGLQGLVVAIYGGNTRQVAPIFPTGVFRIAGLNVGVDQAVVVFVSLVAGLGLMAFFRWTTLGVRTRAVVDNRTLAGLAGTDAGWVTRFAWMLGCSFAAASGILFAPFVQLDSILLTLLVVDAFSAAVIGRLRSFPITAAAAFGLGIAQSLATKVVGDIGSLFLNGLPRALPFIILFIVVVLVRQTGTAEAMKTAVARGGSSPRGGFPARSFAVLTMGGIAAALMLSSFGVSTLTFVAAYGLVFASLSLLVGLSAQLSLCHAVFVALGATTVSHLQSAGIPWLIALPLAALLLTPLGAMLALPAIRLSSLYLGFATLGFGVLAQNLLFQTDLVFGATGLVTIRRPEYLAGDRAFCLFVIVVVLAGLLAVETVRTTRLGRVLTALRDAPNAVATLGVSALSARLVTFCVSTFLAALAGGLLGSAVGTVNSGTFGLFQSLLWVALLIAIGSRTLGGVVISSVLLVAMPAIITSPLVREWQPVAFGLACVLFAQRDDGLLGWVRSLGGRQLGERSRWRLGSARTLERSARLGERAVPSQAGGAL